MASLAESARLRIREEMDRKGITTREVADLLEWSQGKVGHLLTGYTELGVDDLGALCFAVGISPVEAVRDRGTQFCAEMTPMQLRVHERIKQMKAEDALWYLLEVKSHTAPQGRRASGPTRPRPAKAASKPPKKDKAE